MQEEARDSRTSFVPSDPETGTFRTIYEKHPDAAILTDAKARIRMVNPATERLFGKTAGELHGRSVLRLFSTRRGEPDRTTIPAEVLRRGELADYETYIMRPDGERRAVSLSVQRAMDKGVAVYIGTIRDVTRYIRRIYADHLTGLGNLAAYEPALVGEVSQASVLGRPLGLLWVDHDTFGVCNKRYGYGPCSELLRASARLITDKVPPLNDFYPRVFRYGGDEMPILLSASEAVCLQLAHEIRADIAQVRIPTRRGEDASTTASIGLAMLADVRETDPQTAAALLEERAGKAVFAAKDRGRNMVVSWRACMR